MRPDMTTAAADLVGRRDEWPWSRSYDRLLRGGRGSDRSLARSCWDSLRRAIATSLAIITLTGVMPLRATWRLDQRPRNSPPSWLDLPLRVPWPAVRWAPARREVLARAFAVVVSVVALFLLFDVLVLEDRRGVTPLHRWAFSLVRGGRRPNRAYEVEAGAAARREPRRMRRPSSARGAGRLGVGGP